MSGSRSGLVAVLFTDLVGSTELMAQLGDRAFDDLRRRHFAALSKAVAAHGGEEVKNTGDGLMAVFPSAAEAVEGAVAMQQATARQANNAPLAIRVGIAVGDATFEAGDYFGTPVVEAARLVGAARPGQILITQIGRALAGARCTATFTDQESLTLKGLPVPVAVCEVGWQPAGSSVPMPALLTDIGRIFVGRDAEVERLQQLWKEAAAGERRVVFVAGEPGVGKTRLAAELAIRVHDQGGVVLAGRCDEDLGVPYQPFVEALRHFIDHTPASELRERLGRYGGELARLVPELTERIDDLPRRLQSDPETERYRLFDAVAAWLSAAAAEDPLLFVLDDLQWAAKPTVLLLRHVVRFGKPARWLILGTYRDTELRHDHPLVELLADLRREREVERISLAGFDSSGVATFMTQAAGHEMDDEGLALARAIYAETEGIPFFVREVIRHLTETGALQHHDGRWTATMAVEQLGIPEGVREVVGRRFARLSEEANRILRVAAVVGTEFEVSVVARGGNFDDEALLSGLEEALAARLVAEIPGSPPRQRFAHALVRDTLYDELSVVRRAAIHRKVAEALEAVHAADREAHLAALAHHWSRAAGAVPETIRAADYATQAGDRALAQLAHDEAVSFYRQALELLGAANEPPDSARRVEALLALGEAQRRAGDPSHRQTLLDAAALARSRGDSDALARAAVANARGISYSRVGELDHERIAVLEAALDAVGEGDLALRARLMANLAVELVFSDDRDRRVALSDAALAAARASDDDAVLAHVLMTRYYTILAPSTLSERLANTGELLAVTGRLDDPFLRALSLFLRIRAAVETADVDEADRCLAVMAGLDAELRQPFIRWFLNWTRAGRELLAGRFADADRFADAGYEVGRASGQPEAHLALALERFGARFDQGRFDEAGQALAEAAAPGRLPLAESLRSLLASERGEHDRARELLGPLARDGFSGVQVNNFWVTTLANAAAVSASLAETEWAEHLYTLLEPYAAQLPLSLGVAYGSVSHYLGMLASSLSRFADAENHFAFAANLHERIGAPVWLARTRLEWARMLLARGEPGIADRARELLGQARATARELGLAPVERRAVELLS